MLFGRNFYLGLFKILSQNLFFCMKKLLLIIFLCAFFLRQKIKMNQQLSKYVDFTNAAKSFTSDTMQEKWDGKVT